MLRVPPGLAAALAASTLLIAACADDLPDFQIEVETPQPAAAGAPLSTPLVSRDRASEPAEIELSDIADWLENPLGEEQPAPPPPRLPPPPPIPAMTAAAEPVPAPAPPPASAPAPPPAGRTRTQALIDTTANGALAFWAVSPDHVVHIQSGMSCGFGRRDKTLVRLFVSPEGKPGDKVGYDYASPDGQVTVFAMRQGEQQTKEVQLAQVVAAISTIYPGALRIDDPVTATAAGVEEPVRAAFAISLNGTPYITSIWVGAERGWIVEARATFPSARRQDDEFLGSIYALQALHTIWRNAPQ